MKIKHTAAATSKCFPKNVDGEERLAYETETENYFDWDIRRFPNGNIM